VTECDNFNFATEMHIVRALTEKVSKNSAIWRRSIGVLGVIGGDKSGHADEMESHYTQYTWHWSASMLAKHRTHPLNDDVYGLLYPGGEALNRV